MESAKLHIKNMICPRCIYVVEKELSALGAEVLQIDKGYALILRESSISNHKINTRLKEFGFELMWNPDDLLIEKIKIGIYDYINHLEEEINEERLSHHISKFVGKNYNALSKLFSRKENETIENYYIKLRLERVKELLNYSELSLSEIATKLGYSSVHYLSNQFKRVNGFSVSEYKNRIKKRDKIYQSIEEAVNRLCNDGYTHKCRRKENYIEVDDRLILPDAVKIIETHIFGKTQVLHAVEAEDGLRGLLLDEYPRHASGRGLLLEQYSNKVMSNGVA